MILIDTNVGIWQVFQPDRLGAEARRKLASSDDVRFSALLAAEITIKTINDKLPAVVADLPEFLTEDGLQELPLTARHAVAITSFPELRRHDPFDRLYLGQAWVERAQFITADRAMLGLGRDWIIDALR